MNTKRLSSLLGAALGFALLATSAHAALATIDSITGYSGGTNFGGGFAQLTDGVGIGKPDPNDPATWTNDTSNYPNEWYDDPLTGATNGKHGWVAFDLGIAMSDLDELYVFSGNYLGGDLAAGSYNVYYATTPTVSLPDPPAKNSAEGGDYDFASGGWTQLGATQTVTSGGQIDALDLSSIASAQYIGLEIMSSLKADDRVGYDEVAITAVPEPSSFALLAGCFGLAWVMVRRRS